MEVEVSGAGLGMAIGRDIALLHGAELTLDGGAGQGLKVTVRFPSL